MDSLYVVMPAYNEEDTIAEVVTQWYRVLENASPLSRLVVADSGSTDRTHEILSQMRETHPQLEILENTGKQHGPKLLALYRYAAEKGADFIFQTDSDGQTNPEEFSAFWNLRENHDVILGYRDQRGDGISRLFVEKTVCVLLRLYFGVRVPDANAPFRLMRTAVVKKYLNRFRDDYNIPNIMLTTFFAYYKENLAFRRITFLSRQGGTSSINIPKIIKIGWQALHDFHAFKQGMKAGANEA